uniref:Myosin motor domain-containing protein n=1 Tax=Ascaris lumbricoides TaxID=6252 RepID=A0A0M3IX97_ASCLU
QSNNGTISQLCKNLYEIDESELRLWLSTREIHAAGETVRKPLNRFAAITSRDALAKMLYGSTFAWIVKRVNGALLRQTADPRAKNAPKFIGVLDIYGRDALAKMLYGSTFAWIVKRVNGALLRQTADPRAKNAPKFIGVLDIYG